MKHSQLVVNFSEINMSDLDSVGGKNASLGELRKNLAPLGMNVPDGFATTAEAYRRFLKQDGLEGTIGRTGHRSILPARP